jgi:opacity protein-like surface antigen
MKKFILAALVAITLQSTASAADAPKVNEKVMKAFTETFNTAQDILWSELNGVYEARFVYNDIITRVRYDEEGNTLTTIRYYYEAQLPLCMITKIKQQYAGLKVHSVTEETVENVTEYHIVLEDAKNWTMVVGDNMGGLQVEKRFVKA